ncbi:hypothetical protein COO91_07761 [Nostoc flagelliforme CCNUN1]|uniref:Transmembrane protein n=1 Tax=Nostoc flagelliforme CCNUN1 TaxID=2038116 RepID=A0A2K8T213_9NOSO|nr:hypothetical protein [Nostoc flagelliforme]AUB41699.1 hypothetical protein COO91_07761 [Nostoc flagelliforme CCNUN1]
MAIKKINSSLPLNKNLPRRGYAYLLIAALALVPIITSLWFSKCNSVTLQLKAWEIEYIFQKGACATPPDNQTGQPSAEQQK